MIVVPAPLEIEKNVLIQDINRLVSFFSRFQIDIGDGEFVKNMTVQTTEFVNGFSSLQRVENAVFDFHLMVKDPSPHIEAIQKLPKKNVGMVFIHMAVFPHLRASEFGLVLSPEDRVENIPDGLLTSLLAVQIMTVYPGFQGQSFLPEMLIKIEQLRKRGYKREILLDGGVNEKTLPRVLQQKYVPDVSCIGSFLTKAPSEELEERVDRLRSIIDSTEQISKENRGEQMLS